MNLINQPPLLLFLLVFIPLMVIACAYKAGPEFCGKFIICVVSVAAGVWLCLKIGLL